MGSPKPQGSGQFRNFHFLKKASLFPDLIGIFSSISVPQTDTGGLVEKTKVIGRKRLKELGKTAGRNLWEMPSLHHTVQGSAKDANRLFN